MLDCNPFDDLMGWDPDAVCTKNKNVHLSNSKMENEVD